MSTEITVNIQPLLLTPEEAATAIGISTDLFYRNVPKIIARHGLTPVLVGKTKKYSLMQLKQIVSKCARTGEPLFETGKGER